MGPEPSYLDEPLIRETSGTQLQAGVLKIYNPHEPYFVHLVVDAKTGLAGGISAEVASIPILLREIEKFVQDHNDDLAINVFKIPYHRIYGGSDLYFMMEPSMFC